MNKLALACILALYVGVVLVESQSLTMWGPRITPHVRQPGAENLRPETQDKPGLTRPVIGAGPCSAVQDRAWVGGGFAEAVYLRARAAAGEKAKLGEFILQDYEPVGELMSSAVPSDEYVPLLPPAATRENTDRSGHDAMGNITDWADSAGGDARGTPGGRDGQNGPGVTGKATWYHPSLAGGIMRDGVTVYQPYLRGAAAATSWPIGTRLTLVVTRSIEVVISDTGHLGPGHVDLSEADFAELAPLSRGVISVGIREGE